MPIEIKHIDVPKDWEIEDDYSSHRPLLFLAVHNTSDNVVEFGCGYGSTQLLRDYCWKKRTFLSFETDEAWAKRIGSSYGMGVENYLQINARFCGLLFVDSKPGEERKYLIAKHAYDAQVIVVHDSESSANYVYGMAEILSMFKYRIDYQPEGKPHTTAVSNFINIEEWVK